MRRRLSLLLAALLLLATVTPAAVAAGDATLLRAGVQQGTATQAAATQKPGKQAATSSGSGCGSTIVIVITAGTSCVIGPAIGAAGHAIGGLLSSAGNSVLDAIASWVIGAATTITAFIAREITATTSPQLTSSWYERQFAPMAADGGGLALLVTMVALSSAALRRNSQELAHILTAMLRAGFGTGVVIALTMLGLGITDQISAAVVNGSHVQFWTTLNDAWGTSNYGGFGSSMLAALIALIEVIGALMVWLELIVRNAVIYIAVLFLPLSLAAGIWQPLAAWPGRLARLLGLFLILKPVALITLSLGANAAAAGLSGSAGLSQSIGTILAGIAIFILAAAMPWGLMLLLAVDAEHAHAGNSLYGNSGTGAFAGARRARGSQSNGPASDGGGGLARLRSPNRDGGPGGPGGGGPSSHGGQSSGRPQGAAGGGRSSHGGGGSTAENAFGAGAGGAVGGGAVAAAAGMQGAGHAFGDATARGTSAGAAVNTPPAARSTGAPGVPSGGARTGKTYTAGVLRHVYETAGYTVLGVAPTNHSARELTEAGVTARTLDSRVLAINTGHDLPRRSVVILDEAGMAGTRLTERLLTNAAHVDAKVIAIGDPGQLASVQAGGWLAAISKRSGGVRLTEVERQRDRDERLALAGLHDGDPARWLQWAEPAGRVEVLHDGLEALQQTVSEWAAGAAAHGVEQSIMICRDNATREALNQLARDHRHGAGELGEQQAYGPITVAVGDRVICRDNSRDLDVDNGTRGTVRHIDHHRVVIETDAHLTRELPAGYVAEHVEHAYALTGHGMQGGTVEQARVLASPHELTRGWAYTALSRARGQTRLLVREGHLNAADRADYAPGRKPRRRTEREVLADVAHHMRERDDQDLAIDQLTPGRARDPQLRRPAVEPLEQDLAGAGGGAGHAQPARGELARLRDHLERLTAQLAALPTRELADIEDLDSRARDLTERRDAHRQQLAGLPAPKETWGGRVQDPHLVERSRLSSALAGVEEQLERILSARATLARQLGDPAAIRQEHHDLTDAIQDLRREHDTLRDQLVGDTVERQPRWLTETLGPRPDSGGERERWQHAAEQLARYRIEHDIPDSTSEPPLHPPTGRDRDQYDRASVDTQHDLDRG
jgi:hypothetical protein